MPARPRVEGTRRGYIVPIGGKLSSPDILGKLLELAGGAQSRVAIIPTASSEPDMGVYWEREFKRIGAGHAKALPFERRSDCDDADWLAWLAAADAIFLTGGNQLKLTTILGGTPVAKMIRSRNAEGVHVAGTSAGAAFLSEHMIAYGDEGSTPRAGMVTMCAGVGLTNRFIVDQHFRQRDRLGRLLTALSYNPFAIGLGVDEDTAAFIDPDETIEVVGSGAVTVVDCADVEFTSMAEAKPGDAITLVGVRSHLLGRGARFNLHTRRVDPVTASLFHD